MVSSMAGGECSMECDSERIRPVLLEKPLKKEWEKNDELGKHEGLVAKRKLKTEAGITPGQIRVRVCDYNNVQSVLLPPEDNIAALDFGTTHCSLAFTAVGNDKTPGCLKLDTYRSRVPNAILLHHKLDSSSATAVPCEIKAFGYKAQTAYTRLRPSEIDQHLYFERIKMNLQHDPGVHREMTVHAQDGSQWYLIEVIAFMIQCVKDWLEDQLSRSATPLKATDFNWVITVPAIWQARGRGMMREAAYMAGLCSNDSVITCLTKQGQQFQIPQVENPECLTLAPEPDAAALYCQHMTETGRFAEYCEQTSTKKSHQYVVIDIGGGTVDITAQKVLEDGSIKVIQAPTGNSWGGTAVNRELVKLVQGIVREKGDPFNLDTAFPSFFQDKQIRASQKAQVVEAFYDGFEGQKEIFSNRATLPLPTDDDQHISFVIPSKFFEHYRVQFDRFANENTDKRIELEDDTLFISYHCAKELFQPAIDNILECTESVLSKLSGQVDTIFLVGGFGGCNYVYQHIKLLVSKQFSHLRLIVPLDSKLAIAIGAVRFRQPATKFVSRVVDASYGLAVSVPVPVPYDSDSDIDDSDSDIDLDDSHFKYDEDGDLLCTGVFLTFINEGEIAEASEVAVEDIMPLIDNARTVTIPIYRSYTPALKYIWKIVNEQVTYIAHKVGELVINIPKGDITHRSQRTFRVMFDFSGPEIQVFARYMSMNEQVVGVALDFLKKEKINDVEML